SSHSSPTYSCFFLFYASSPTELYTLSLHDALPILAAWRSDSIAGAFLSGPSLEAERGSTKTLGAGSPSRTDRAWLPDESLDHGRSEEHTSELQSRGHLVCRLLLEKKKKKKKYTNQQ